ncbi:NAD(P)H-binding protein [Actinomadura verrucosospora]|uniref:NAD-dependent epimerase/dehydratase n=1 Tax=Actinomadura verrucosospora TaxID=46165 RepID=A0A7D4A6M6_ACTVE|nr:NAD(P)H-binding protein [Actinomadura verrucosospora]QKG26484.1 NAD-dependent epimerase/dehydratase [Actinomadura verrucosospora]
MEIVIAGGHGQIALRLSRLLAGRGDAVVSLIRNPDHAADVRAAGATPVVRDLEAASADQVAGDLSGADAVVFAAGAGPGSGAARKDTVDRAASVLLADAAERAGVRGFVQVSAMGAGEAPAPGRDEVWAAYIRAKGEAEDDLRARAGLDWLILRPGRLTDDPGTGLVTLAEPPVGSGAVTRDDVAGVIVALLDALPGVRHRTLDLLNGDVRIADAVAALR